MNWIMQWEHKACTLFVIILWFTSTDTDNTVWSRKGHFVAVLPVSLNELFIQAYPDASLEATNSAIRPWDIQDYSRQM